MLNELETTAIQIAVMARTGQLKAFSCSQCSEELQQMRNCTMEDSDAPVIFHPTFGQLFTCPLRMIPQTIISLLDEMDYYTKYPSAYQVPYDVCNTRYWDAVKLYDQLIMEFENNEAERRANSK